jgi:2-iminobutanoate/2-iminopropanoate deaminase
MEHDIVDTQEAPRPVGPYSQGVRAGSFLFVSGQVAIDPESGDLVAGGIEAQTERVLRNAEAILRAAGTSLRKVVKTTVYLSSSDDYAAMNKAYERYFGEVRPARTTVVAQLPRAEMLVEMDFVASV